MGSGDEDGIYLKDAQGRPRIVLQVHKSGVPHLRLLDENGLPRLELTMGSDGDPILRMFSEKGTQALSVGLSSELSGATARFFAFDGSHCLTVAIGKDGVEYHSG